MADISATIGFKLLATKLESPSALVESRRDIQVLSGQKNVFKRLYQLSQILLCAEAGAPVRDGLLKPMQELFSVAAIVVLDSETGRQYSLGTSRHGLAKKTRSACICHCYENAEVNGVLVRALRKNGDGLGAIGFEGLIEPPGAEDALADVAAAFLERRRSAVRVAAHIELRRCALMDELAHRLKTPLTTIMAAAGGLRETGPLRAAQRELADLIESEALRLSEMSSSLVRAAWGRPEHAASK